MPIDADLTAATGPMPDMPPPETVARAALSPAANRHGLRLALGTSAAFALALVLGWPLATFSAVFVALFLQGPAVMPPPAFWRLFQQAVVFLAASWLVSSVLAAYAVPLLIAIALAVAISFRWSTTGAGMLSVVLALMASLMIPNLVITSKDLTLILVIWIPANLAVAWLWTVFLFWLLPASTGPAARAAAAAAAAPRPDPGRLVLRMSLVTIPFAMLFFLSGSGMLITLFFVAILSMQLAAARGAGPAVARGMLKANLIGGIAAIIAYEITAIAPLMLVAMLAVTLAALTLARWFVSEHADSALAGSALTTLIIVYGGAISPFTGDADVKMLDRLWQVGFALGFVLLAYLVVDALVPLDKGTNAPPRGLRALVRRRRAQRARP